MYTKLLMPLYIHAVHLYMETDQKAIDLRDHGYAVCYMQMIRNYDCINCKSNLRLECLHVYG